MSVTFDQALKANYLVNQDLINIITLLANRVLGKAGISIDANTNDVETDNAIDFVINGIVYQLAAQTAIDISGLDFYDADGEALSAVAAQADDYDCLYVFSVNASGTIIVSQATAVALGGAIVFPTIPSGYVPLGAVKVVNETGSAFTFGTTGLDTSGITDTYYDLSIVPAGMTF